MKQLQTRYCARGVIFNPEKKIILGRELNRAGKLQYKVPGGGIEGNETLEKALINEALEEVGVEITNIEPLGYCKKHHRTYKDIKKNILYRNIEDHWFTAIYVGENPRLYNIEGDGMEYDWVTVDEAIERVRTNSSNIFQQSTLRALHIVKRDILKC